MLETICLVILRFIYFVTVLVAGIFSWQLVREGFFGRLSFKDFLFCVAVIMFTVFLAYGLNLVIESF
jgi:hypothetical protein